ncbi:MAG: hypothetical protein V4584_05415 [Verrucomicrobiota bacterium]
MSENENQPPAPSKQTSSVPLKKETVRVTLKAADAPPAVPSATVPIAPPVRPPVPGGPPTAAGGPPRPPAPAPTIPLRTAGAPTMAPAPTIRLATTAAPTGPVRPAGGAPPTMALPKATVQLQAPTQPLGTSFSSPSQMSTLQADDDDDDVDTNDGLSKILAGVGFAAALVVLALQLSTASTWISAEDSPTQGDWMQLF